MALTSEYCYGHYCCEHQHWVRVLADDMRVDNKGFCTGSQNISTCLDVLPVEESDEFTVFVLRERRKADVTR